MSTGSNEKSRRLPVRLGVEVYRGEKGDVVLKQEGLMGDDDAVIVIDPRDADAVATWIREVAAEIRG